jgi:hypothetical protein
MEKYSDGQHRGDGTGAPNNGQRTIHRDPLMGHGVPTPPAPKDGDVSTESEAE